MKIASLRPVLSRVLFSPGVQTVRDPRTGVWNFPSDLGIIPNASEFDFGRLPQYIKPSQDPELQSLAQDNDCQFVGSTSTLTRALSQIYFAITANKGVELSGLSQAFSQERTEFTTGALLPASLVLSRMPSGVYTVDSDKRWDTDNVLSEYGRILEKQLVSSNTDFRRFMRASPESAVPVEERTEREAYRYRKYGSLLMRSQLDCHDLRLPGDGTFDIKTRACLPIRYDRANYEANSAYDIHQEKGMLESFERELYDLSRTAMLKLTKYSMQARIGNMDGIFIAYHNTKRIYGFQYLSLADLDERLFGSTALAEAAFRLCVALLESLLKRVVEISPEQEVYLSLRSRPHGGRRGLLALMQPRHSTDTTSTKDIVRGLRLSVTNVIAGESMPEMKEFPEIRKSNSLPVWDVQYTISAFHPEASEEAKEELRVATNRLKAMASLSTPEFATPEQMTKLDAARRLNRSGVSSPAPPSAASSSPSTPSSNSSKTKSIPTNPTKLSIPSDPSISSIPSQAADPSQSTTPDNSPLSHSSNVPISDIHTNSTDSSPIPGPSPPVNLKTSSPGTSPSTPSEETEGIAIRWTKPTSLALHMRKLARESGEGYEQRSRNWLRGTHYSWVDHLRMDISAKGVRARKNEHFSQVIKSNSSSINIPSKQTQRHLPNTKEGKGERGKLQKIDMSNTMRKKLTVGGRPIRKNRKVSGGK
ncbi:hypothetical protein M231_02389 [Tremella mesenterica]|uniref:Pet127-domain-containing protein n=1 Tax=Tremella mesenterica TaxID=5217 RepID=A0A4Q1BQQ9_TREME|nr:hypothetical protein M231_02389 [Tremella mesenterica]